MALYRLENEAELLINLSKGDEKAFGTIFYAYYNQLGEFVQLLTRDLDATSEIIQEVFAKVWLKRETLPKIKRFDAYLFILCRNYTLNYLRKQASERKNHKIYLRDLDGEAGSIDGAAQETQLDLVEKAIQLLPPQQQQVFALRRQGMKNPEISRLLNISNESVKKYQYLAMKFISDFVRAEALIYFVLGLSFLAR